MCFPVNIAKFFKNTYFEEHLRTAALASYLVLSQPAFTCSKLAIEKLEQGVKYVQS